MAKRRRSKKPFALPKFNFLGIGIVYVLIYIPQIYAVKIGYTGSSVGSRVRGTSKAVFGFTIPVFFMVIPLAWHTEQTLHWLLSPLRYDFYKGDGHTETFFLPAGFFVILLMACVWWAEYSILEMVISAIQVV